MLKIKSWLKVQREKAQSKLQINQPHIENLNIDLILYTKVFILLEVVHKWLTGILLEMY